MSGLRLLLGDFPGYFSKISKQCSIGSEIVEMVKSSKISKGRVRVQGRGNGEEKRRGKNRAFDVSRCMPDTRYSTSYAVP